MERVRLNWRLVLAEPRLAEVVVVVDLYRLTSVTFPGSRTVSYGYDDASRRTSITYPGGSNQVAYTYDAADRLTGISHVKDGSTTVASVAYTLDDIGNRTGRVDQQGTFDDADRSTGVQPPSPAAAIGYDWDDSDAESQAELSSQV